MKENVTTKMLPKDFTFYKLRLGLGLRLLRLQRIPPPEMRILCETQQSTLVGQSVCDGLLVLRQRRQRRGRRQRRRRRRRRLAPERLLEEIRPPAAHLLQRQKRWGWRRRRLTPERRHLATSTTGERAIPLEYFQSMKRLQMIIPCRHGRSRRTSGALGAWPQPLKKTS
jgi:hypothetical protein